MQSSKQAIADSSTELLKKETTISLDNSRPGRSGLDESVPSRYALKVGEIDVMVVSDGVLSLPGAMLGHNVDPAVRGAWLEHNFLPPDVLEWALNVVVKSGDRTILIDAGLGADPDLNLPRAGRLIQRLEATGVRAPRLVQRPRTRPRRGGPSLLRAEGLHSCPQMAWSQVRETVAEILSPPDGLTLFCGMSIGYEDPTVAYVRTGRAPLTDTVTFIDDSGLAPRASELEQNKSFESVTKR